MEEIKHININREDLIKVVNTVIADNVEAIARLRDC